MGHFGIAFENLSVIKKARGFSGVVLSQDLKPPVPSVEFLMFKPERLSLYIPLKKAEISPKSSISFEVNPLRAFCEV